MTHQPPLTHQPQHLRAILFDFDGTLVDTEPVWMQMESEIVAERGGVWPSELAEECCGGTQEQAAALMLEVLGEEPTASAVLELADELSRRTVERVASMPLEWRPGVAELIAEARAAGIPCAVVTSSPTAMTDAILPRFPEGSFDAVITCDMVEHRKPHPLPYLLAAEKLGVDIARCVVIEDSETGATAGEASGAVTVGCPCDAPLSEGTTRVLVDTIAGKTLEWFDALVGERVNEVALLSGIRRGPLMPGERVTLTDPKGRRHSKVLAPGKVLHTTKGGLAFDDIIGRPEGIVVRTAGGLSFLVMRPLLSEYTTTMPREATPIYPKDAAQILMWADIFPGARVLEAGVGSGGLSLSLLRAIGPTGRLYSYERRDDFARVAQRNVEKFLGRPHPAWVVTVGDLVGNLRTDARVDRVILDMLAPWECIDAVAQVLEPGGVLCCYVATTTQLGRVADTLRVHGGFTEPHLTETTIREWHAEGLAIRPGHGTSPHTGFLVIARRLAPGVEAPMRKRRPAPGAYGPDYTGPRPKNISMENQDVPAEVVNDGEDVVR